jgi:hypothetical protein
MGPGTPPLPLLRTEHQREEMVPGAWNWANSEFGGTEVPVEVYGKQLIFTASDIVGHFKW